MSEALGPVAGLAIAAVASAAVVAPFLLTSTGRRALGPLGGDPYGEDPYTEDPYAAAATSLGLAVAYAGAVVLAGESATRSGPVGLTLTLLLPFAFGVAAATVWLPSLGVEWRPAGEDGVDATVAFAGLLATLTAAAAGGWLLVT